MRLLRHQEREGRTVQNLGGCLYIWCSGTTMYNNIRTQKQDGVLTLTFGT